ncbi:MAG: pyridoxal phosphate-dependent aminotransferase [Polyangiales bacterium]
MPRFPGHARSAEGLSDRVFGQLVQKSLGSARRVHPLHVGDTYLDPLPAARAEAQRTSDRPRLHNYAPVQGEPELIDAILRKVQRRSGVLLERGNVQVMSGATGGLGVICSALLEPDDELILLAPFWPLIRGAVRLRGAVPVEVPFYTRLAEPAFDPIATLEAAITPRTAAIYLNSPHNPTGAVLPEPVVAAIAALAVRHNLWVLTDEVYEDLWYGAQPPAAIWARAELAGRAIATHSVSKAYGLAGARVGFTHGPTDVMQVIRGVQTFYSYCAPRPMQLGAARALDEGDAWLADARMRYAEAARVSSEALGLPMPAGGTFLFFDASPYLRSDEDLMGFLERCLDAGVMLTPGSASGRDFERWARLCYTSVPPDELGEALDWLKTLLVR